METAVLERPVSRKTWSRTQAVAPEKKNGAAWTDDDGTVSSGRNRSLTEGFGIWADDAQFDEINYRDRIWQPERNVW
jgi:hypothetical protein